MKEVLLNTVFPNRCVLCDDWISREKMICNSCEKTVTYINAQKRCLNCGHEKKYCVCLMNVYHFSGCVAPFFNDGDIRRALIELKYGKRLPAVRFFAEQIADSVKKEYVNIPFHAVCFAPTTQRSKNERGYDQAELLAKFVAKELHLPLLQALCRKTKKTAKNQHELSRKERFDSIRGAFVSKRSLNNQTVLLIDDIMTTGASLDEAARTLLFAGAREVYAAVVAITPFLEKEEKDGDDRGDRHRH